MKFTGPKVEVEPRELVYHDDQLCAFASLQVHVLALALIVYSCFVSSLFHGGSSVSIQFKRRNDNQKNLVFCFDLDILPRRIPRLLKKKVKQLPTNPTFYVWLIFVVRSQDEDVG